jgi:hypothetical protein
LSPIGGTGRCSASEPAIRGGKICTSGVDHGPPAPIGTQDEHDIDDMQPSRAKRGDHDDHERVTEARRAGFGAVVA